MKNLKYFHTSFAVSLCGLFIGAGAGYLNTGRWQGAFAALFLTAVLGALEVSLSVDNAVVNASILRQMTPLWRHRFLTWGMLIAVFGMRIIFPLAVVSVVAHIGPWQALVLAATRPTEYANLMLSAHVALAGFGSSFLLMVCLRYFFDEDKEVHWLPWFERSMVHIGQLRSVELGLCMLVFGGLSFQIDDVVARQTFLTAGAGGLLAFVTVELLTRLLKFSPQAKQNVERASAALFVYLEILDASFSFDGVIGAFALTENLFIIAAGLSIGSMFVRSLTILLVEKESFGEFRYLEHGAFYAIGALALVMMIDVLIPVPEMVTGLVGALIIGLSLIASMRHRRRELSQPLGDIK